MGFTEILTIIFVLLKAFGVIDWSWWLVFAPEIVALVLYVAYVLISVAGYHKVSKTSKTIMCHFDKF